MDLNERMWQFVEVYFNKLLDSINGHRSSHRLRPNLVLTKSLCNAYQH